MLVHNELQSFACLCLRVRAGLKNAEGATPLHAAARNGRLAAAAALLAACDSSQGGSHSEVSIRCYSAAADRRGSFSRSSTGAEVVLLQRVGLCAVRAGRCCWCMRSMWDRQRWCTQT